MIILFSVFRYSYLPKTVYHSHVSLSISRHTKKQRNRREMIPSSSGPSAQQPCSILSITDKPAVCLLDCDIPGDFFRKTYAAVVVNDDPARPQQSSLYQQCCFPAVPGSVFSVRFQRDSGAHSWQSFLPKLTSLAEWSNVNTMVYVK